LEFWAPMSAPAHVGFRGQYIKRPVVLRRMVACDIELVTNLVTNLQSNTGWKEKGERPPNRSPAYRQFAPRKGQMKGNAAIGSFGWWSIWRTVRNNSFS